MTTDRERQVATARLVLERLGFDVANTNERSALVLLALLGLTPKDDWSTATNLSLTTHVIRQWIEEWYQVSYAPNTRETIRRFTLHQFVEAGLVESNPDEPGRPVNSPKFCYRVTQRALVLLRTRGASAFEQELQAYLLELPGLKAQYAAERDMARVPVTLPDGQTLLLSSGGQNVLVRQIVEQFCSRFTPAGHVLYLGDASWKFLLFRRAALAHLGVRLDEHGKMPDLVVHLPDRNWLVLLEAASSHGPVDAKRRRELEALFADCTAGLVYVSCFPSRAVMRRYLAEIAWETEAWCADAPTHLVHFNGERFLGPY